MLDAVVAGKALAIAKFPAELVFKLRDNKGPVTLKSKQPQTLGACNEILSRIQMEKALRRDKAENAVYEADCYALNKLLGLEAILTNWSKDRGGEAQKRSTRGAAAASYALGFVGTVSASEPSGEEVELPDAAGKTKKVKACRGHQLYRRIWLESASTAMVNSQGGEAGVADYKATKASWCGIFANWVLSKTGLSGAKWESGGGNMPWYNTGLADSVDPKSKQADPKPGDVAYAMSHSQHFCIVANVSGNTVITVDGNTSSGGGASGGQILVQSRDKGWYSHFFQWK